MALFIRHQLSPYCIEVQREVHHNGRTFSFEAVVPAMSTHAPVPHGRNSYEGGPDDWGPDRFGCTDFDDYHLELYGA